MTPDAPIAHDWLSIGQTFGLFIIGIITAWTKVKQNTTSKTVEATALKVDETAAQSVATAQTVDKIHDLTNGSMTAQKNTVARVTATLAAITKDPADEAIAKEAMKEFVEHVSAQSSSKTQSTVIKTP